MVGCVHYVIYLLAIDQTINTKSMIIIILLPTYGYEKAYKHFKSIRISCYHHYLYLILILSTTAQSGAGYKHKLLALHNSWLGVSL